MIIHITAAVRQLAVQLYKTVAIRAAQHNTQQAYLSLVIPMSQGCCFSLTWGTNVYVDGLSQSNIGNQYLKNIKLTLFKSRGDPPVEQLSV